MKMSAMHTLGIWSALLAAGLCFAAHAQTSGTMEVPGATAASNSILKKEWTDKNGDGLIQKDELAPGAQLSKRFDTRDANHDGTLTRDEYYY